MDGAFTNHAEAQAKQRLEQDLAYWRHMYDTAHAQSYESVEKARQSILQTLPDLAPALETNVDTDRAARYRAVLVSIARMPLYLDEDAFFEMEEMWHMMAAHFGFEERFQDALLKARGNTIDVFGITEDDIMRTSTRYMWSSVFAYVWVIAKHAGSARERCEAFTICNRYMGLCFDCFYEALAVINEIGGVFPDFLTADLQYYTSLVRQSRQ